MSSDMRHKGSGRLTFRNNRLVIELEDDLTSYYRKLVGGRMPLLKPSFGSHITIAVDVDGSKYDGQIIEFEYSHLVRISGDTTGDRNPTFYFLDVWCDEMIELRHTLGLETYYKFHITIGRLYY